MPGQTTRGDVSTLSSVSPATTTGTPCSVAFATVPWLTWTTGRERSSWYHQGGSGWPEAVSRDVGPKK